MGLLAGQIVGRTDELAVLEQVLGELDRGSSAAIELVGEPGIGKTWLLRALATRASDRGHLVLAGSSSELEQDVPFSVFVDALDEYVESLGDHRLADLDGRVRAELAHVLPSLSGFATDRHVAVQQERYLSHRAVRALLELLAQPSPLVLLLDDVHWADPGSVELLGTLLRKPPAAGVLMAVALRPGRVHERLSAALERAQREGALNRIEVGPLTPAEARQLVGETVGDAEARVLYEESGGNPFYLEQLARSVDRAGTAAAASQHSPMDIGVPTGVVAALRHELALLSADGRLVIEGAAVAGDPFESELAAAAAATSEEAALDAIDELLEVDLIRSTDVPRRFSFRHPLVRRAVYEATAAGWRLGAHERCAGALAARGVPAAGRAHHVERSAHKGDPAAIAVLREAGEAAARLAPASAARWLGAALRLLPDTASDEERTALLVARAGSLAATGRFAESRADLLACIEIAPEPWHVRVTTACAAVERLLGLQTEAHRHLTTALAELREPASPEAAALMIQLTVDAQEAGDLSGMRTWAQRSVDAATPLGDRAMLAAALAVRAWAGAFAGDGDRAQKQCDEATEAVDGLSDEELARQLGALAHLATADLYLDRFAATTRHAQRALQIGRATGQGDQFPRIVAMLGGSLWVQGRPLEAEELLDGAVEAARLAGNERSLAWNLCNLSFAAFAAGSVEVALATAEESFELMDRIDPRPVSAPTAASAAVLAHALFEVGEPARSVEVLVGRAGGEEVRLIGGAWRARFLELLTRAHLASGEQAAAERAMRATQACADAVALPSAEAMARLAAAAVDVGAGRDRDAAEHALAAAAILETVGAVFDAARARALAGRAFAQAGERDRATSELQLAAAAFASFGSTRYRNQAERELRKLGRHIGRRTSRGSRDARGTAALTARELEIARLVVDRMTNPEIAAELFVSQKTVETHLRNIFNKMGVATRVALARAIEREDRLGRPGPDPAT